MDIDDKEQPSYIELEQHGQGSLLDVAPDWAKHWQGMPEFKQKDLMPWQSVMVHFKNLKDRREFSKLVSQNISDLTKFLWYPKQEIISYANFAEPQQGINLRYPIYIVSKGRWESRLTARALDDINVSYHIVIEPQEYEQYAHVIPKEKILTLPFSNLGQGSIPARNWIWEHSVSMGDDRHWILDDNICYFVTLNDNIKKRAIDGTIFKHIEDFADKYENVALTGMNYEHLAKRKDKIPPYVLNTRIYSCILIKNDIPYRWRGRYNEDTDLSLRALKDGWCTVQFNAFLADKTPTLQMKGGNTDELYAGDGRLKMAQSLQEQHPDVVTITEKFHRWQHQVNYQPFKKNKLILKEGLNELESDVASVPEKSDPNETVRHDSPSNGQAEENKRIREGIDMQALKESWAAIQHKVDEEHVQEHLQQMFRF